MRLHHRLTLLEAKEGPEYVLNELPAESYQYTHVGMYPETLRGLNEAGKLVFHYANLLHCQSDRSMEEQDQRYDPPVTFNHLLWKMHIWMEDIEGEYFRFKYYHSPRMYDLAKWGKLHILKAVEFLEEWKNRCGGGRYLFDQVWMKEQRWWSDTQTLNRFPMLLRAATIQSIFSQLRTVTFNGEWEVLYPHPCMFENVDRFYPDDWDTLLSMFEAGEETAGSIFSVAGSPRADTMREALETLKDTNAIVEFTNPESEALVRQELY